MPGRITNTLQHYERNGAALVREAFGDVWIDALRRATERALVEDGVYDEDYAVGGERGRFFETTYLWCRYPEFRDFAFHSTAKSIARRVMASSTVALFYDQVFVKEPGTAKRTPWHQDRPYWALQGSQMCSIWLALDDIAADNCIAFVAGSHHWDEYRAYHFMDRSPYRGQEALQSMPEILENGAVPILAWDLRPGDCIVFHPLVIHGAPGNSSRASRRRAVVTRWIGDDVTYRGVNREFAFPKGSFDLRDGEKLPENLAPRVE
ncbi:MAG: phytanoyl-CoA dioxygenase family protein [Gammaproteobacteria bacterium]|nr:phytanoyl-CoA dioxygenase family protein [Gammaproteobacteria bacterium]